MRLAVVVALLAVAAAGAAALARGADECAGLQVCLPVPGPWVAIPAGGSGRPGVADYLLACPRRGYIVGGTDVRLSERQVDVGFRGETGSPIGPGTTTLDRVVFTGVNAGDPRARVLFRPFLGCVPTRGGGARSQTARSAPNEGLKPTRPVQRLAAVRPLRPGTMRIAARCPGGTRVLGAAHTIGFRVDRPPSAAVVREVTSVGKSIPNGFAVTATTAFDAVSAAPEVQVLLLCVRTGP